MAGCLALILRVASVLQAVGPTAHPSLRVAIRSSTVIAYVSYRSFVRVWVTSNLCTMFLDYPYTKSTTWSLFYFMFDSLNGLDRISYLALRVRTYVLIADSTNLN